MPQRIHKLFRHIDASEVQGEGAFVDIVEFTHAEMTAYFSENKDATNLDLIAARITAWNWVDDNGDPLPLPGEKPGLIHELPYEEALFLIRSARGDLTADERKNS
jgi:hypothetical protein